MSSSRISPCSWIWKTRGKGERRREGEQEGVGREKDWGEGREGGRESRREGKKVGGTRGREGEKEGGRQNRRRGRKGKEWRNGVKDGNGVRVGTINRNMNRTRARARTPDR